MKGQTTLSEFVSYCNEMFPGVTYFTRTHFRKVQQKMGCAIPSAVYKYQVSNVIPYTFDIKKSLDMSLVHEQYKEKKEEEQRDVDEVIENVNTEKPLEIIDNSTDYDMYIPEQNEKFVSHGTNYNLINAVVSAYDFLPMYIYGISGVGKTMQIEQSCAINRRPFFRCQITKDTTNEDLIGSYSLINGNTIWSDGPVLKAYRSGGILLLDEIDLNPSLMILQVVLEDKPIYVQQTGELVKPKKGFNVFATGNTKGDGGDGRYIGTSVLNDAFLERFVTIIEQKLPSIAVEKKIINRYMEVENITLDERMYDNFIRWIDTVRETFQSENTDIYISSRRIQYILKMYKMTGNFQKSMQVVLARYPDSDADAFMKVWKAISG